MASALDTLSSYMTKIANLKTEFPELNREQFSLLTRKEVFPYDHIDCEEKLKETELPDINKFYNKLNDNNISQDHYEHAKRVWAKINIKILGRVHGYMNTDI